MSLLAVDKTTPPSPCPPVSSFFCFGFFCLMLHQKTGPAANFSVPFLDFSKLSKETTGSF